MAPADTSTRGTYETVRALPTELQVPNVGPGGTRTRDHAINSRSNGPLHHRLTRLDGHHRQTSSIQSASRGTLRCPRVRPMGSSFTQRSSGHLHHRLTSPRHAPRRVTCDGGERANTRTPCGRLSYRLPWRDLNARPPRLAMRRSSDALVFFTTARLGAAPTVVSGAVKTLAGNRRDANSPCGVSALCAEAPAFRRCEECVLFTTAKLATDPGNRRNLQRRLAAARALLLSYRPPKACWT